MSRKSKKIQYWKGKGGFAGIPKHVLSSPDFLSLSPNAVRLLVEFAFQYTGYNNGDLSCEWQKMKKRGFRSENTVIRARNELSNKRFIELTRVGYAGKQGKRRCHLFALTYQPIDEIYDKDRNPKLHCKSTIRPSRRVWDVSILKGGLLRSGRKPGPLH